MHFLREAVLSCALSLFPNYAQHSSKHWLNNMLEAGRTQKQFLPPLPNVQETRNNTEGTPLTLDIWVWNRQMDKYTCLGFWQIGIMECPPVARACPLPEVWSKPRQLYWQADGEMPTRANRDPLSLSFISSVVHQNNAKAKVCGNKMDTGHEGAIIPGCRERSKALLGLFMASLLLLERELFVVSLGSL